MSPILAVVLAAAGAALLAYAVLLRLGARPWARDWASNGERGVRTGLLTVPGGGAGLLALAVADRADDNLVAAVVLTVCLPVFVVLMLLSALQLRVPLWLVPGWARESVRLRRAAGRRR
ncbi:hypothetical protein [Motilibacter aurantiacus]|uniref:hypothetical protein n=1 Tax=Motilibacter aurantiacus TaxID=2714955 RepID=UPI00140DFA46|nr:hypothetical protein [Motilibacter aurantiacus]NHC45203.1 hypothetical protein [Motilibacter aurantiacus]